MTTSSEDQRLEDLSAQVLTRSAILTSEQIAGFRVAIARMEGKLDAALALKVDFEDFETETRATIRTLEIAISKLDSFKAVAIWVAGLAGMVLVGSIGTIFAFMLNKGP